MKKIFVGIIAGEKLFFESSGDSVQDEEKQNEIVQLFCEFVDFLNKRK